MARASGRSRNGSESSGGGFLKAAFRFLKMAEFEILFVLFFVVAFIVFKDLVSLFVIRLLLFLLCLKAYCLDWIGSGGVDRNDSYREIRLFSFTLFCNLAKAYSPMYLVTGLD